MFKKAIKAVALAMCVTMFAGSMDTTAATMRKDVLAGEKTLPGSGEFNVIAEPFDWGKDVTRIMLIIFFIYILSRIIRLLAKTMLI